MNRIEKLKKGYVESHPDRHDYYFNDNQVGDTYEEGFKKGLELAAKALDDVGDPMAAELVRSVAEEEVKRD